jgi:hypothetical protein
MITQTIRKMMLNMWIIKRRILREIMIMGILGNHQKDPNWVVKQGHEGV